MCLVFLQAIAHLRWKNADHGSQPGSTRQSQTLHHGGSKQSSIYLHSWKPGSSNRMRKELRLKLPIMVHFVHNPSYSSLNALSSTRNFAENPKMSGNFSTHQPPQPIQIAPVFSSTVAAACKLEVCKKIIRPSTPPATTSLPELVVMWVTAVTRLPTLPPWPWWNRKKKTPTSNWCLVLH